MTRPRLYLAAPLFSPEERQLNLFLAHRLEAKFQVFLPQRDGHLIPGSALPARELVAIYRSVFDADIRALDGATHVFAVLNGRTIDEGVSFELGYAFAHKKSCIGYLTDSRVLLPCGINPMIREPLARVIRSDQELEAWLSAFQPP